MDNPATIYTLYTPQRTPYPVAMGRGRGNPRFVGDHIFWATATPPRPQGETSASAAAAAIFDGVRDDGTSTPCVTVRRSARLSEKEEKRSKEEKKPSS